MEKGLLEIYNDYNEWEKLGVKDDLTKAVNLAKLIGVGKFRYWNDGLRIDGKPVDFLEFKVYLNWEVTS